MCGIPGVGKTTWAYKYLKNIYYTSRDNIRFSLLEEGDEYFSKEEIVFKNFIIDIVKHLEIEDVVADATHLTRNSRKKLISAIDKYLTNYKIIYIALTGNLTTCIKQNNFRFNLSRVPEKNIKEMFNAYKVPMREEDSRIKGIWIINN